MEDLCQIAGKSAVVDFVCPFNLYRKNYDLTIWMNTIEAGRFEDTNKMFEKPNQVDYEINDYNYANIIKEIQDRLE
jgi:adenylylsulfate kinase